MALTVNTNVTSSLGPGSTAEAAGAQPLADVSAGLAGGAGFLAGLLSLGTTGTVSGGAGLRAPINPENAEALLLLVESTLDQATAASKGQSIASRFGTAQDAIITAGAGLSTAEAALADKQGALATDQAQLKADQMTRDGLQTQFDQAQDRVVQLEAGVVQLGQTVAALQSAVDGAAPDTDLAMLRSQLSAAQADLTRGEKASDQAQIDADVLRVQLAAADAAVTADTNAVAQAQTDLADAKTALQQAGTQATAALSQVAAGLRSDGAADALRTVDRSQRRDLAYDDVSATAKRFRDGDVQNARQDGARREQRAAVGTQDRAVALATDYAAAVADALATIQAFAATPPPAVSQTAAFEANGRVRLSL